MRRFIWSDRRPGVATTIWGRRFRALICLPMGWPPYRHTSRTPSWHTAIWRISSVICMASSRVGARITAWTSSLSGSMRSMMGMPKAMVLPVPVGALAMTSFPSSMGGMHPAWTGVLISYPLFLMARMVASDRPKLSKGAPCVNSIAVSSFSIYSARIYYTISVNMSPYCSSSHQVIRAVSPHRGCGSPSYTGTSMRPACQGYPAEAPTRS